MWPDSSIYCIKMPNHPNTFPIFHAKELKPYVSNDPAREPTRPPAVITENSIEEWNMDKIIAQRCQGIGYQYLVCWTGYPRDEDHWLAGRYLKDCKALDVWENKNNPTSPNNSSEGGRV